LESLLHHSLPLIYRKWMLSIDNHEPSRLS
jgi:hypothetical protein